MRKGRGGKEKEWTDCVQSDTRAFGVTGDWKVTCVAPRHVDASLDFDFDFSERAA